MPKRFLSLDEFKAQVADGLIFTVEFTKRTTGETRVMNARLGVKKYLRGGTLGYNPAEKNLLGCYDVKADPKGDGYRMINLDGLHWVKLHGDVYDWTGSRFELRAEVPVDNNLVSG